MSYLGYLRVSDFHFQTETDCSVAKLLELGIDVG